MSTSQSCCTTVDKNLHSNFYIKDYRVSLYFDPFCINSFNSLSLGEINTVSNYICYLSVITYKFSHDLTSVVKLVDMLMDDYGEELIEEITQSFTDIIYDVDTSNQEEDVEHLDINEIIESQIELIRLLLLRIFNLKKYL